MICSNCRKHFDDKFLFCPHCGTQVVKNVVPGKDAAPDKPTISITEEPKMMWGYHINSNSLKGSRSYNIPSWVTRSQKEDWGERGCVVWDETSKTVSQFFAGSALSILDQLIKTDQWKTNGITIGRPATRIYLDEVGEGGKNKQEPCLSNPIHLTGEQSQEFLVFLQANENLLKDIAKKEDKEKNIVLDKIYRQLLGDELLSLFAKWSKEDATTALETMKEFVAAALNGVNVKEVYEQMKGEGTNQNPIEKVE